MIELCKRCHSPLECHRRPSQKAFFLLASPHAFDCIIFLFLSLSLSLYSVWCRFKNFIFCFSRWKHSQNHRMMNENNLWKTVYHHLSLLNFSSQNQRKTNKNKSKKPKKKKEHTNKFNFTNSQAKRKTRQEKPWLEVHSANKKTRRG